MRNQPIHQVVQDIAARDPSFPGLIRGATAPQIARLERTQGRPFPAVYREYLEVMGQGTDWLRPNQARFDVESLTEHLEFEPCGAPAGYLKIGLTDEDPFFDIYLEETESAAPRVVTMPRGPAPDFESFKRAWRRPLAGSLPGYLGTAAFRSLRLARCPRTVRLAGDYSESSQLARVANVASGLGLTALWFSNDWVQVSDSAWGALIASHFPGGALAIDLGAEDAKHLQSITRKLRDALRLPHEFPIRG